jgi:hypothetical protein
VSHSHLPRWRLRAALLDDLVDGSSLAAFRMLFGVVMFAALMRVMRLGWVDEFYVVPPFHFTWALFPWVQPLPGWLMQVLFAGLAVIALGVALGFHYRACAALFFAGFTYVELIDKAVYLNHYYLVTLLSGLLLVAPAHRMWSVDAWRLPKRTAATVPAWAISLVRFQIAVVFVFAGLAKLNADWLLDAQPLRIWLAARSDLAVIGPLFTDVRVAYAFSWFGAAYDLTIVPLLLWRRTRLLAYATVLAFHTMTWLLFPIGMFPWIMIVATPIFFSADWPRRLLASINSVSGVIFSGLSTPKTTPDTELKKATPDTELMRPQPRFIGWLIALYVVIQIAVPLRGYWPGVDPDWTGRGFNFAWRVMIAEKAGDTTLVAHDRLTGKSWPVRLRDYVTERQEKMMAQDPFMIRTLARHVAADLRARGMNGIEVHAESFAALNGRPVQRLIDPDADLAGPLSTNWIVPLKRDTTEWAKSDALIDP